MPQRVLTLDVGKTGCRAVLFADGERAADAAGPGPVGLADHDGVAAAVHAMAAVVRRLDPADGATVVAVGLAGFAQALHRAGDLAGAVLADPVIGHGVRRVVLASDMTTSHAGALAGRPGVVVAAGTGSVTLAVDPDGRSRVVDGWGYLLGDAGSGFALGRAGLKAALRAHDGRGGSPALLVRGRERFGDPDHWPAVVHGSPNPPGTVAAFARDVLAAAEAGDRSSLALWEQAGRTLADAVDAAVRRTPGAGRVEVAATGGLFDAGSLLLAPFRRAIDEQTPRARVVPRAGDAHDGALLLATRSDLPHEHLVRRTEAPA